jgi:hypothetical protein
MITLQQWANVTPTCWLNVAPMSKITLAQYHFPTLDQRKKQHWANIGPTVE